MSCGNGNYILPNDGRDLHPGAIGVRGISPVERATVVELLRAGASTGLAYRCIRKCALCGQSLGTDVRIRYGLRWLGGSEHFLLAHGVWTAGCVALLRRHRRRLAAMVMLQTVAQTALVQPGYRGFSPPPPGPYTTAKAAKAWAVWVFSMRAEHEDAETAQRMAMAAKMVEASPVATAWEVFAVALKESIRIQRQPVTGELIAGIDAMAAQSGFKGWLGSPATNPLPSQAYYQLKIACFLALDSKDGQVRNPDVAALPALGERLLQVAVNLVNASGFSGDQVNNYAGVVALCDFALSQLPQEAKVSSGFIESIRAVAKGTQPRTWEEIAKNQAKLTMDWAADVAKEAAKGAGEIVKKTGEGLDESLGEGAGASIGIAAVVTGLAVLAFGAWAATRRG